MADQVVRIQRDGAVARLSLARPQKLNALNVAVLRELTGSVDELADDLSVRVVVLRGEGRAFSAGADLGGGASAGAAGLLYSLLFPVVNFFMGFIPGLKAFTAAVLGGIGNVPGAFLGAMALGLLESIGPLLFLDGFGVPAPYQLKDAIAFIILVLILIFRPTGILGERLAQARA